jgi:hypothetical protein
LFGQLNIIDDYARRGSVPYPCVPQVAAGGGLPAAGGQSCGIPAPAAAGRFACVADENTPFAALGLYVCAVACVGLHGEAWAWACAEVHSVDVGGELCGCHDVCPLRYGEWPSGLRGAYSAVASAHGGGLVVQKYNSYCGYNCGDCFCKRRFL